MCAGYIRPALHGFDRGPSGRLVGGTRHGKVGGSVVGFRGHLRNEPTRTNRLAGPRVLNIHPTIRATPSRIEAVPDSAHGPDQLRIRYVDLKLLAEPMDMDIDCPPI